jgi:hypothetical protein
MKTGKKTHQGSPQPAVLPHLATSPGQVLIFATSRSSHVFPIWDPQPRSKAFTTWIQPEPGSKVFRPHRSIGNLQHPQYLPYQIGVRCFKVGLESGFSGDFWCVYTSLSHFRNHGTVSTAQAAIHLCHLVPKRCPSATLPAWSYLLPQLPQRSFESLRCTYNHLH